REKLSGQLALRTKWETIEAEYVKAIAIAEGHKRAHQIAKGFVSAIKTIRETMMHAITAPLSEGMDRFFAGVEDGLLSYVRLDNDPGRKKALFDMGWSRMGRRTYGPGDPVMTGCIVDQAVLSGGERPLFIAALADAITVLADPPLRLHMQTVSECGTSNFASLLRGIESRAEDFGTVILEIWEDDGRPLPAGLSLDKWNVIDIATPAPVRGEPVTAAA
ncbi:MAG: hypothetical protein ABFE01_04620, partial [Phycisphaerales bacterium]